MIEKAATSATWQIHGSTHLENSKHPSAELFKKIEFKTTGRDQVMRPSLSYWRDAWQRIKQNKLALASGMFIVLLTIASLIVPLTIQYTHYDQEVWNLHLPPNLGQSAVVVDGSNPVSYAPIFAEESSLIESVSSFEPPAEAAVVELYGIPTTMGIALRWAPVEGAEGYAVYRSIDSEQLGVPLHETKSSELSVLDNGSLRADTTYYYRVLAVNSFGESEPGQSLEVLPALALTLDQAKEFAPLASVGDTVSTPAHYLGTDYLGRDMLARVMIGARVSLLIGFGAPLIYILIGIIYGGISGYFGGFVDDVMMRIADIVSTIPDLLMVIMLQVFLGSGVFTLIIALVLVAWARSARQIRGETLKLREAEFVQAARVLGTSTPKILLRHIFPNVLGTVLVLFTLAIPQAIFTEAFLSFIGLGIEPPLASWGSVTREGAKVFLTYPHELVIPAGLICITMFAFNMLGDGLRDALDPKLRGAS